MSGFEDAWQPITGQVAAMCRAQAGGRDADELYQRVMIRAWRGHDGFRGDSAYLTWVRQIIIREAGRLGLTATACAVTHCRAVPKLRVFLFLHRPGVLGGLAAIKAAFERSGGLLTLAEAEAFRFLVIEGRHDYRRRGWQTALRGGCATVAGQLTRG